MIKCDKRKSSAFSGLKIFFDPFFFKLKEFAELIVSDVIIAAFVIRFPDFTGQALCSATGHAGDILDIPVLKDHATGYMV